MKIVLKVLLLFILGFSYGSCDGQTYSLEDILQDEEFSQLMNSQHKSTVLILSDKESSKLIDKVYNEYMVVNRLSSCDYNKFDKSIDTKVIEYYENECVYFTKFKIMQDKYGDLFVSNFRDLNEKFKELNPEYRYEMKDLLKRKE